MADNVFAIHPRRVISDKKMGKVKLLPMYKVILHNDDVNSMHHVVGAIKDVFGFEAQKCVSLMLEAHNNGLALCKIEPLEHAEFHREKLQSYSLTATIEPS